MKHYYLKIGKGNCEADAWLSGANPLHRPAAVIFFDDLPEEEYERGGGESQAREFWLCGKRHRKRNCILVLIRANDVWFLRSAGMVRFLPAVRRDRKRILPKAMPVEIIDRRPMKSVPFVLASMGTHRYLGSGTFREITYPGNLRAIAHVLRGSNRGKSQRAVKTEPERLLECLASVEFETLVAKIFEAAGCHVPAYRGGSIQDIDIMARNLIRRPIIVGGLRILPGGNLSVQVKLRLGKKSPKGADVVITGERGQDGMLGAGWVLDRVRESRPVLEWLERSLSWLPESFLAVYGLRKPCDETGSQTAN